MKKIQELLDSPYYRIKFSYYQQGKFYSQGNVYLYLPYEFDENKIIDFVRKKLKIYLKNTFPDNEDVQKIDNFLLEDFIPVKREQYLKNYKEIKTMDGNFSKKIKLNKNTKIIVKKPANEEIIVKKSKINWFKNIFQAKTN